MSNYYGSNSCKTSTVTVGNSIDINLNTPDICQSSEVRADVVVDEISAKRVWGRVVNCQGQPIANALAKLVKVVCIKGKKEYIGVAHTITNCEGFYQFDVCADDLSCYKIIVNKATTGKEVILDTTTGNCNTCNGSYSPCAPVQPPVRVPSKPCGCGTAACPQSEAMCPPPVLPCPQPEAMCPPPVLPCPPPELMCPPPMLPCPPPEAMCPPPVLPCPPPAPSTYKQECLITTGYTMCK
ncbi:MAG: hypothetical protein ACRDDX_03020 [Cellulosilyticaceae bacterium]